MNYTGTTRPGNAERLYTDAPRHSTPVPPASRAGRWLLQRYAITPELADILAQLAGLGSAEVR